MPVRGSVSTLVPATIGAFSVPPFCWLMLTFALTLFALSFIFVSPSPLPSSPVILLLWFPLLFSNIFESPPRSLPLVSQLPQAFSHQFSTHPYANTISLKTHIRNTYVKFLHLLNLQFKKFSFLYKIAPFKS